MPEYLAGRDQEVALITDSLERAAQSGEATHSPTVFTGPRGHGKTALLRHLQSQAEATGYVTAWVSCVPEWSMTRELVKRVSAAWRRTEGVRPRRRSRLEHVDLEAGVPGLAKGAARIRLGEVEDDPAQLSPGDLAEFFQGIADAVRTRGGAGLVVCVDEAHALDRLSGSVWINAVQYLSAERRSPVLTLVAGLPSTRRALQESGTFSERFTYEPLQRLDAAAVMSALLEPASRQQVSWGADALARAFKLTDGYPYFVQLLGQQTWQAAKPQVGDRIEVHHVEAGAAMMQQAVTGMFRSRWQAAHQDERQVLSAVAAIGGQDVTRADVAAWLGVDTRALSRPRAQLIERGLIEAVGHGRLSLSLPGFREFVRGLGDEGDERDG